MNASTCVRRSFAQSNALRATIQRAGGQLLTRDTANNCSGARLAPASAALRNGFKGFSTLIDPILDVTSLPARLGDAVDLLSGIATISFTFPVIPIKHLIQYSLEVREDRLQGP